MSTTSKVHVLTQLQGYGRDITIIGVLSDKRFKSIKKSTLKKKRIMVGTYELDTMDIRKVKS